MSKRKHGDTIKPWLSANHDCKEGRFIQCGNSLLLSQTFQQLSSGAKHTYFCMAMESGGKRDFIFPLKAAKKYGISKNSLSRYVSELVNAEFLSVESGKVVRQPNCYTFSFEWKTNNAAK